MARLIRPGRATSGSSGKKGVATSDWHLSPYGSWRNKRIRGDAEWGVRQVLDYARDPRNDVAEVWVGGDNWETSDADNPEMPALQARVRGEIGRDGTPTIKYVIGNHDRFADWLCVPGLPHVRRVEGPCTFLGRPAHASSYLDRVSLGRMIESIRPGTEVFIGHQSCLQLQGSESSDLDLYDLVEKGIKFAVLGDYHVNKTVEIEGLCAVSPGPLCLQAIDEEDAKGFFVFEDTDQGLLVESIGIRTRATRRVSCASLDDLEEVIEDAKGWVSRCLSDESVPDEVRAPILVITALEGCPDPTPVFEASLAGSAHLFVRRPIRPRSEGLGSRRESTWARTWDEALSRRGAPDDVRDLSRRLLQATDLRGELRRAREEAACG